MLAWLAIFQRTSRIPMEMPGPGLDVSRNSVCELRYASRHRMGLRRTRSHVNKNTLPRMLRFNKLVNRLVDWGWGGLLTL